MDIASRYRGPIALSIQSIRAFAAVAQQGSFAGAAELLKVSQPTVSAAVARLETHTGNRLFRRERGGAVLTREGQRILPHALRLAAAADELEQANAGDNKHSLVLGFMGEAASTVTGQVVRTAQEKLDGPVRLRRYDFDAPTGGLASGESHMAIIWPPLSADYLDQVVITSDRRAVALPVSDPLASRPEVAPDELLGRDWVVPRSPDPTWTAFRHPRSIGTTEVGTLVESGSVEETLELVAAGAGIALLSESTEQHYARAGVVIVPLAGNLRCTAALAWRRPLVHPTVAEIVAAIRTLRPIQR